MGTTGGTSINCNNSNCGFFWADVSGFNKKPNQVGRDMFYFILTPTGVTLPNEVAKADDDSKCYLNGKGLGCSRWVIEHSNTKYEEKSSD